MTFRRPTLGTKGIGECSKACLSSILRRLSEVESRRRRSRLGAFGSKPMGGPLRTWSGPVTALPFTRQQVGSSHLPPWFSGRRHFAVIPLDDAGDYLDAHWAVAVFEPADRKRLLALAEDVRRK